MNADELLDYIMHGATLTSRNRLRFLGAGWTVRKRRNIVITLTMRDGSVLHPQQSAIDVLVAKGRLGYVTWADGGRDYGLPGGITPIPAPPKRLAPRSDEEQYFATFDDCDLSGFEAVKFWPGDPGWVLTGPGDMLYKAGAAYCSKIDARYGNVFNVPVYQTDAEAWAQAPTSEVTYA